MTDLVFVLKAEYQDFDGGATQVFGVMLDRESAERWVSTMTNRAMEAIRVRGQINDHMKEWMRTNPRPHSVPVPNLVEALYRVKKKDRTPEHDLAISKAKAEMDRLREDAYKPVKAWEIHWTQEIDRVRAEYDPQVIADINSLPLDHEYVFEEVPVLS